MWDDIKEYDYMEPIKRLATYYGDNSYYSKMYKMYEDIYINKADILDKQFQNFVNNPIDNDLIIMEYIKCRSHMCISILWPVLTNNMKLDDIIKLIAKYGNICYIKTLVLSKKALINLMFWLYDEYTYSYRYELILKKIEYIDAKNINEITIILYDRVDREDKYDIFNDKEKIKQELMMNINIKSTVPIDGDDIIHISNNLSQTITYSQIVLNKNNIDLLNIQNIENISNPFMMDSHLKIQTFKKWCSMNLSLLEIGRVLFTNDIILYSHGFKKINNIDTFFISVNNDESQSEIELKELMHVNFNEYKSKFFFMNIAIEKSEDWHELWSKHNNEIFTNLDIDNFIELATDPTKYYYFQGFKCPIIPFEILKKIQYNTMQDQADFIILATLYNNIMSQYVQFNKGLLIYKKNMGTSPPNLNHDYLIKLLYLISKQYLKKDIDNLRKLSKI
jgi:hypothetical protein